jgi:hypothetical protein
MRSLWHAYDGAGDRWHITPAAAPAAAERIDLYLCAISEAARPATGSSFYSKGGPPHANPGTVRAA